MPRLKRTSPGWHHTLPHTTCTITTHSGVCYRYSKLLPLARYCCKHELCVAAAGTVGPIACALHKCILSDDTVLYHLLALAAYSLLLLNMAGGWQASSNLVSIVDTPLQTSECTNHGNTETQTTSSQGHPAHLLDNVTHSGTLLGVQLGHQVISGVRHSCAEDTSDVASSKAHAELLSLGALRLGLRHNVLVECLDGVLKSPELHHGVRDLPSPQRGDALEKAANALKLHELGQTISQALGKPWHSLHLDLHSLKWA
mmetsp:Transcript_249/g.464  ORF Transcript_249/g.464 Transcript_249/m.464 type:complete len:257 (-) Transcript_249:600-1370(-)